MERKAKSSMMIRLEEVEKSLGRIIKPLGFNKSGRTFNRPTEQGIVQVIHLQSGQYPIGDNTPLPPPYDHLKTNFYGKFTVNLGVYLAEIAATERAESAKKTIPEHWCQIRTRLGRLEFRKDFWWSLEFPTEEIMNDVGPLIIETGIPFLNRFGSRDAVIRDWIRFNETNVRLSNRARVDVAIMVARNGQLSLAANLLREQIKDSTIPGHIKYVLSLSSRLGLGDLTKPPP